MYNSQNNCVPPFKKLKGLSWAFFYKLDVLLSTLYFFSLKEDKVKCIIHLDKQGKSLYRVVSM